jgi:peptide chain release factor 1
LHKPTGLTATADARSQYQNRKDALRILTARVNEYYQEQEQCVYDRTRKMQVITGRGGAKCRTYNFIDSRVVDHNTGKKTHNIKAIMQGKFNLLF